LTALIILPTAIVFAEAEPTENEAEEETVRFQQVFADDEYNYYLDTFTARLTKHPYNSNEELVDVWIKLEPNSGGLYSDSAMVILQHYYMRQTKMEQQLLSEVVVNGYENTTSEQKANYREENWESLLPETSEEGCYFAVMKYMKAKTPPAQPKKKKWYQIF
jgi:hypothetical protein